MPARPSFDRSMRSSIGSAQRRSSRGSSCCRAWPSCWHRVPTPAPGAPSRSPRPLMPALDPARDGGRWATFGTRDARQSRQPSKQPRNIEREESNRVMRSQRVITLTALMALLIGACSRAATPAQSLNPVSPPAASAEASAAPSAEASTAAESASPAPLAVDPAEAVIPNVEANAEITFWTFYLSPTFDNYIKETIARFEGTYPGVKVDWEDHQGTFKDDLNNAFAAGNAPDVINLSVSEGWVSEYASKN